MGNDVTKNCSSGGCNRGRVVVCQWYQRKGANVEGPYVSGDVPCDTQPVSVEQVMTVVQPRAAG